MNWPYDKVVSQIEFNLSRYYENNTQGSIYQVFSVCGRGWCGLAEFELLHEQWLTSNKV